MTRLLVHVEGQTEETFVNEVLAPHLYDKGYSRVSARLVGNARLRERRGGIKPWLSVRDDICRHLLGDSECYATTMVDYYALPASAPKGWPGRLAAEAVPYAQKGDLVEQALFADLGAVVDGSAQVRFVPYVVMHEFEALLFSDCHRFARGIGREDLSEKFQAIRDQFDDPEQINDSPVTAPSKRVQGLVSGYQKPLLGTLAALEIGLESIRAACPRFSAWLTKLEGLAST